MELRDRGLEGKHRSAPTVIGRPKPQQFGTAADQVQPCFRHSLPGGAAGRVPKSEAMPLPRRLLDRPEQPFQLLLSHSRVLPLSEVGVDALQLNVGKRASTGAKRRHIARADPEPGHAGVHL